MPRRRWRSEQGRGKTVCLPLFFWNFYISVPPVPLEPRRRCGFSLPCRDFQNLLLYKLHAMRCRYLLFSGRFYLRTVCRRLSLASRLFFFCGNAVTFPDPVAVALRNGLCIINEFPFSFVIRLQQFPIFVVL